MNRAWDLDELLYDSHGNLDVLGRLATDRPHVVKLYGAYSFPFGTQIGAFFYAGSGTPISTYVTSVHTADPFVEGRGNFYELDGTVTRGKRTPALTRTDLLLSHTVNVVGSKRLRFELNVQNVFNQKTTAAHLQLPEPRFRNRARILVDRSRQHGPHERLRLQRVDSCHARRRECV